MSITLIDRYRSAKDSEDLPFECYILQVWDTKRQIVWLVAGITFGTFIVYMDAHDETRHFDGTVFAFWEIVLLAIILTLFYIYSRKKK